MKLRSVTLANEEMRKEIGSSGYKYLVAVEMDKIKEPDMKDKFQDEYKKEVEFGFEIQIEWQE